jgi:hypothetical protein
LEKKNQISRAQSRVKRAVSALLERVELGEESSPAEGMGKVQASAAGARGEK